VNYWVGLIVKLTSGWIQLIPGLNFVHLPLFDNETKFNFDVKVCPDLILNPSLSHFASSRSLWRELQSLGLSRKVMKFDILANKMKGGLLKILLWQVMKHIFYNTCGFYFFNLTLLVLILTKYFHLLFIKVMMKLCWSFDHEIFLYEKKLSRVKRMGTFFRFWIFLKFSSKQKGSCMTIFPLFSLFA